MNTIISKAFPDDKVVGEEDSAELRSEAGSTLRNRVVELSNQALSADLGLGENVQWGIGPDQSYTAEELLDAIDRGNHVGGRFGRTSSGCIYALLSSTHVLRYYCMT